MRRLVCVLLAASSLTACASTEYRITPAPNGVASARFDHGHSLVFSPGTSGAVAVVPRMINQGRLVFSIAAYNRSGVPYNIGYENMTVRLDEGKPLPLINYSQLRHIYRSNAAWSKFWLIAATAAADAEAAQASTSRYSGTYSSSYGSAHFQGEYYDARLANEMVSSNNLMMVSGLGAIDHALSERLEEVDKKVLQTTTIDPGGMVSGEVVAELPPMEGKGFRKVDVMIHLAGEDHALSFYVAPDGTAVPQGEMPALDRATLNGLAAARVHSGDIIE